MLARNLALVTVAMLTLLTTDSVCDDYKQQSRAVTAQMRANALANVEKFEWAAARQRSAIAAAEPWAGMSDDELWEMVTSQELPRDIHTNIQVGCPNCGEGITPYGNYPWNAAGDVGDVNVRNASIHQEGLIPWKLKCPNCGEVFPKNDFWAFYQTALDEHGFFRRELGDRSLLFNTEHPDADDPLHKLYVDDGYGMTDEKGNRHRFIAYYNSWAQWTNVQRALTTLAEAYSLTSEPMYAHKAAVLLDRIADVYPDMDFYPLSRMGFYHSHGGSRQGRIGGCIWEAAAARGKAEAYDIIFDGIQGDSELVEFISQKAQDYKLGDKGSVDAICRHIEDNLLIEFLASTKDGRIRPNLGGRKVTIVATATALDRPGVTEEWLDWIFDSEFPGPDFPEHDRGTSLKWLLTDGIDRDGMGGECGNYGRRWALRMVNFPALLAKYPDYTKRDLVAEFPKLKQCFLIDPRLLCLDAAMPAYGDRGTPGAWHRVGSATTFAIGYKLYGEQRMADLAWRYAEGNPQALRLDGDIFEADPDALMRKIAEVAREEEFKLRCEHLGRYGQLVLQTEEPDPANGRAIWMVFGYRLGHRHRDALNLGLYAKHMDMLPDMGYPEYTGTWPKRRCWTSNTVSHNTLVVNDARQDGAGNGGQITLFACEPPVRVTEVSAPEAYDSADTYRRTVALVDASDSDGYVFDVFRARGGSNHRLVYHSLAQTATVEGVSFVSQATGTFAGADVEFAELPGEDETIDTTNGFSYLYDVERSNGPVPSYYTADWQIEDIYGRTLEGSEPHLRLHALTAADEVALASGDPPQNRSNLRSHRYLVQSRLGDDMQSQFVTVLEPYDTTPFISRVRSLQVTHSADPNSVAAVAVEMADGTVDILISCEERTRVQVEGGVEFDGRFGMIRLVDGQVRTMRMSDATLLSRGDVKLEADQPAYEGTVSAINADDPTDHRVSLDPPLPQDEELVGLRIHFHNDVPLDTTYEIKAVTTDGISTGEITVIWGFQDRSDYSAGYKYLVNVGDRFMIPNHAGLDR